MKKPLMVYLHITLVYPLKVMKIRSIYIKFDNLQLVITLLLLLISTNSFLPKRDNVFMVPLLRMK